MNPQNDAFSFRWGIECLDEGYTQIPNIFFRRYSQVGVTRQEFLFILHLAAYKYEKEGSECRPSLVTVAKEMGYDGPHSTYRLSGSLEKKGLLIIDRKTGYPSIYNFRPLSIALISETPYKKVTTDKNVTAPVTKMSPLPVTKMSPKEEEPKQEVKEEKTPPLADLPFSSLGDDYAGVDHDAEDPAPVVDDADSWPPDPPDSSASWPVDTTILPAPVQKRTAAQFKAAHATDIIGLARETQEARAAVAHPDFTDASLDNKPWIGIAARSWCKIAGWDFYETSKGTLIKLASIFKDVGAIADTGAVPIAAAIEGFPFADPWYAENVGFQWPNQTFCNKLLGMLQPTANDDPEWKKLLDDAKRTSTPTDPKHAERMRVYEEQQRKAQIPADTIVGLEVPPEAFLAELDDQPPGWTG